VLVEIDDSFTMDPADLADKITDYSRLIIPVHMCGVPSDMPAIMEIAADRGIAVLEDCAQADGATLHGKPVGTFGDMGMFSFQINKNITAGEGGMLVTDDATLYARANAGHDLGIRWSAAMSMESSDRAGWEASEHVLWGVGSRMSELTAAVVRAQLPKLPAIVAAMRASKHRVQAALGDLPKLRWCRVDDPDGDSGPFILLVLDDPAAAVRFATYCSKEGLAATRLADYGLHVYANVQALVEKRSNSPDGYPWTHPANVPLVREYAHGALSKTDGLLAHSVMLCVPSRMTVEQEDDYIAVCRDAHAAAYAV
jgi:8-amino-3,8-dideoxy-alpha-D-manno-octulosonate transaminase